MERNENRRISIAWITSAGLVETDIYVVPELMRYFDIEWYVVKDTCESLDYEKELNELAINGSKIEIKVLEGSRFGIKRFGFYRKFANSLAKADIIYTVILGIPYFIPLLKAGVGNTKLIAAVHNVNLLKGITHPLAKKIYQKIAFELCDYFDTFSKSQYDLLRSILRHKKVFYTPFMLKDYGKARKQRVDKRVTFLCYGNIKKYKRHDLVIRAAESLYEKGIVEFKVIIAGCGDYWEICKENIKHDSIFDLRIARIPNEDVADLFNEADYLVMPYQDIAQSGAAIVGVNYGVPIISSDLVSFREYIKNGENGYLIPVADLNALTDVMEKCIKEYSESFVQMHEKMIGVRDALFSKESVINAYNVMFRSVIEEINDAS